MSADAVGNETARLLREGLQAMLGGMTVVNSPDLASFSDVDLLRTLTSSGRRPNLLVDCVDHPVEDVLAQLSALCTGPFHTCLLPGPLRLPTTGNGTLLVHDLAALTVGQQVTLFDWLQHQRHAFQVISVTQKRVVEMVCDGRFLEGLFYRLNTISITAQGARGRAEHTVI
jgi:transcriptional regulator of acetoin/glycerol metabolism